MPPRFYYAHILYLTASGHPKVERITCSTQSDAHAKIDQRIADLKLNSSRIVLSSWIETEGVYGNLITLWHDCYIGT